MTDPGKRPHLIFFQRRGAASDDGYTNQPGAWAEQTRAWAQVRYGTGAERREAAQERASQSATFECDWSPALEAILMTDRIVIFDTAWDIKGKATIGGNKEIHFTGVANLDAVVTEPES